MTPEQERRRDELALMRELQNERNALPRQIHALKSEMTELARRCMVGEHKRLVEHIQAGLTKGKAKRAHQV